MTFQIRQTGPKTYTGFAYGGRYAASGSSQEEVVTKINSLMPLELRQTDPRVKQLPLHVAGANVPFNGVDHTGEQGDPIR